MKAIEIKLLLISLLISCTKEDSDNKQLAFNEFQSTLEDDMDYNAAVEAFGEPEKEIGSGIHIYLLTDLMENWIGYSDQILYARHVDQDQNILHTIYKLSNQQPAYNS